MAILKEFKDFAVKGNVIDLAVGVIIGGSFGKIVSSLVDDILMPPLGLLTGQLDFSEHFLVIKHPLNGPDHFATLKAAKDAGAIAIGYGNFLNVVIQFLIMAFVVFILVKEINKLKQDKAAEVPRNEQLLTEIRDLLKNKA
jgi:large conductance mechanosensitive channel